MGFDGDKKDGKSLLWQPEEKLKSWLIPLVPSCVETYHLTLTTVAWSLLIILFSFMALIHSRHWLWMSSLMIVFQYITDLLDGAIGRKRNTGLVKWGYYMDHFLDYMFLCSILTGYSFLVEDYYKYMLFFIISLFGAFMVNSFLSFAATNRFQICYMGIGPTEIRIVFIAINTILIFQRDYFVNALPYALALSTFGLFVTVFKTQHQLWILDMKALHGDGWEPRPKQGLEAFIIQNWSLQKLNKKIIRNIILSFVITGASYTILALRLFPHYKIVAATLYGLSWVPLIISFLEKRVLAHARKLHGILRPYILHIIVALALLLAGYSAHVLIPVNDTYLATVSTGDLRRSITDDRQSLNAVVSSIHALINSSEDADLFSQNLAEADPATIKTIRDTWQNFINACVELDLIRNRYRGFYKIDILENPDVHATAFYLSFSALAAQMESALRLTTMVKDNPDMARMLNEKDPIRSIDAGCYTQLAGRCIHPDELLRLNAGSLYLQIVKKNLSINADEIRKLESSIGTIYKTIGKSPDTLIKNPVNVLENAAFKSWFPIQKEVAYQMSVIRTSKRDFLISSKFVMSFLDRFEPGDIILERRNWVMSNIGIPGFWPHVAFYIGSADELDNYFSGLPALNGKKASEYIRELYPKAHRVYISLDGDGYEKRIIEALQDGSVFTSLEISGSADYIGVLRPRMTKEQKFKAVLAAFKHHAKPYDYDFDFATDSKLVCSELVYKCYQESGAFKLEPYILNGRILIAPNYFAELFDTRHDSDERQMDFVLFLDGKIRKGNAVSAGEDEFRASWKRPKWEIMQE